MDTITLRGHHLRILYRHYIKKISLETIEIALAIKYNKEQAAKVVKILSNIVKGDAQITFTDNLDDICAGCSMYDFTCDWNPFGSADDKRYLEKFGFRMKKQYTAKEVLGRLKKENHLKCLQII